MADTTTKCPNCETAFRVTEEQLAAANGMVRCGKCMGIFNASDNQISVEEPEENLPRLTALIHNEFTEQQPEPVAKNALAGLLAKIAVFALGALILAGQYIYFFSGPLSQNQNYRQLLMDSCQQLGCQIEPFRDSEQTGYQHLYCAIPPKPAQCGYGGSADRKQCRVQSGLPGNQNTF